MFKNKKILIMGLGLHGGGVSAAKWFLKQGARVRITDLKTKKELAPSIQQVGSGVHYTLGRHKEEDFLWAHVVVQNPGVPRESPYLMLARSNGAAIENEATLFFQFVGRERIIGVTGTRGKSTTSTLIYELLKKKYKDTIVAGQSNTLMFSVIDEVLKTNSPVVIELSSWQLENLGEKKVSPHVAVWTNLYPDHLNRYFGMKDYQVAKANILHFQNENDYAILNWDNAKTLEEGRQAKSRICWFSRKHSIDTRGTSVMNGWVCFHSYKDMEKVMPLKDALIQGEHNIENILAAVCAAKIFGVKNHDIASAIQKFQGLFHRLEKVCEKEGIVFINDSAATTPDATIAALKTLGFQKKNIILIAGGADKRIPLEKFHEMTQEILKRSKGVVLFQGKGSKKILQSLRVTTHNLPMIVDIQNMSDALGVAKSIAKKGDIILLSPACASFGLFLHEFDRGDQFRRIAMSLSPSARIPRDVARG